MRKPEQKPQIILFLAVRFKPVGGVAQWYNVGLWPANFPCPALDLQLGKPSATGQPTRPTQPFILSGSIK